MRGIALGALLGCMIVWQLTELLPLTVFVGLMIIGTVLLVLPQSDETMVIAHRVIAGCLLSVAWIQIHSMTQLNNRLPITDQRVSVNVIGVVCSLPKQRKQSIQFTFCVDDIRYNPTIKNTSSAIKNVQRIVLSWYFFDGQISPGQRWQIQAKVMTPYSLLNPGGFDAERWALVNKIDAKGYIQSAERLSVSTRKNPIAQWRFRLLNRYSQMFSESEYLSWHKALAFGWRDDLSVDERQLLQSTGTAHLLSISGLHIGLVFLWGYWCVSFLLRCSVSLSKKVPAEKSALIVGLCCAVTFALLAGWSLPTQRALVALSIFVLSRTTLWSGSASQTLSLTFIVMIIVEPLGALSESFWLTMNAIAVIYFVASMGRVSGFRFWLLLQSILAIAMSSVSALLFNQWSTSAVISNWFAIPVVSFVLLPFEIIVLITSWFHVESAMWLMNGLDVVYGYFVFGLTHVEQLLPLVTVPHQFAKAVYLLMLMLLIAWRFKRAWILLVLCLNMAVAFWIENLQSLKPIATVVFLDIGQGMSVVIDTQDSISVYDVGYADEGFSSVNSVIKPYLRYRGVRQIDSLIISHNDVDHNGDWHSLAAEYSPKAIYKGENEEGRYQSCDKVLSQSKHVSLTLIQVDRKNQPGLSGNNQSCVAKLRLGDRRFLLTGDIEKTAEMLLIQQGESLAADGMTLPHHGSKTSSSWSFIAQVSPQFSIAPAGYLNRFNHPSHEVVERYVSWNIPVFTTWQWGMLEWQVFEDGTYDLISYRRQQQKYWNHPATGSNSHSTVLH